MNKHLVITALLLVALAPGLGCASAEGDAAGAEPAQSIDHNEYVAIIEKLIPGMGATEIPARKDAQLELEKLCHEAAAPSNEAKRAALASA